ncbi:MAG: precorrin-3B C(17)-methyltransferase, partial [Jatrophihabitans sp.]
AREVLLAQRPASTPVGLVTNAGRDGEQAVLTTLGQLSPDEVGMNTVVIIGASSTSLVGGWMVTDRALEAQPG